MRYARAEGDLVSRCQAMDSLRCLMILLSAVFVPWIIYFCKILYHQHPFPLSAQIYLQACPLCTLDHMMDIVCRLSPIQILMQQETVQFLSEFLVCEHEGCFQGVNICHKGYFRETHFDVANGKKITHKAAPFDESIQFANFYAIGKLHEQLTLGIAAGLRGVQTNLDVVVQTAIYASPLFMEIFNNSQQAIGEFLYLRNIQKGLKQPLLFAFSEAFCTALLVGQERRVGKAYKQAIRDSAEWEYLNAEFNLASGINSSQLESFIEREAAYFVAYCQALAQQGKDFSIGDYVSLRATSQEYQNDPYYFGSEFTHFLTVKYERHPEREPLFDVAEYYLHFWEYFHVSITKNVASYFEEELSFYKDYEQAMSQASLKESFLGFRMWRLNHRVSTTKPSLRNPFFLESYIYSFIEDLIHKKLFYPQEKRSCDFRQWARFLKDYVKLVRDKNETFSFGRYREYFDFRSRNEKFEEGLATNKDIIYNRIYFLEYAHNQFLEGNKLAGKKYRKHLQARKLEEQEKAKSFKTAVETLRNELLAEEKDRFYEIIFINYVNAVQEDQSIPNKQTYIAYKTQALANIDESLLQEEQAKYRQSLLEQGEVEKEVKEQGKKQEIVKEEINQIEQRIAELIVDEEGSASSSQEEQQVECPCCKGKPFDCRQRECQLMGACVSCQFD